MFKHYSRFCSVCISCTITGSCKIAFLICMKLEITFFLSDAQPEKKNFVPKLHALERWMSASVLAKNESKSSIILFCTPGSLESIEIVISPSNFTRFPITLIGATSSRKIFCGTMRKKRKIKKIMLSLFH